jgi:metal-responsive CopG/Arc/MetJ family transcriptional regulator
MLKPISITLPENMIEKIDDTILKDDFSCRSDFFRHLVRMWFLKSEPFNKAGEDVDQKESEEVDYTYGIPPAELEKIKAKAKLLN